MNIEDQKLARAVVRRLCSETAAWTDERLDADPMCQWVECLFRKVRDEVTNAAAFVAAGAKADASLRAVGIEPAARQDDRVTAGLTGGVAEVPK